MATSKPDLTRTWAATAPGGNVIDPDVTDPGKYTAGWIAEVPPFEHFNFLQKQFSQGLAHANEQGIMVWDTDTTYPLNGIAKGSNGGLYRAVLEQSGNDPTSDGGTNWVLMGGALNVANYTLLKALTSSLLVIGQTITITDKLIGGDFVVRAGTVTDHNGIQMPFTDNAAIYADRIREGVIWVNWCGADPTGGVDSLAAFDSMSAAAKDLGSSMGINSNRGGFYSLSDTWLTDNYLGEVYSDGAIIKLLNTENTEAIYFRGGTPDIKGTLRIFRDFFDTDLETDWASGNFDNSVGLKVDSATKIQWDHLDIQGFFRNLVTDCDGNDINTNFKRFTECVIEQLEIQNGFIQWDIPSDNSGFFTDVTVNRLRLGGGAVQGVTNAKGIRAIAGSSGSIQGPTVLSYNISDFSGTGAIGIDYDSRRTMSLGDGWFEGNTIDINLPTPTQAGTIDPIIIGLNLDEKFITIANASGRRIQSRAFGLGGKNTGDTLSTIAMHMQSGTDIQVQILDEDSGGSLSAYNQDLFHSLATVVKSTDVTGATNANPCVITNVGHGHSTGFKVGLEELGGITELNKGQYVITVLDVDTYELDGVDSTGFGTYTVATGEAGRIAEGSSGEGTVGYLLNLDGDKLIVTIPGLLERVLNGVMAHDGSAATKTLTINTILVSTNQTLNRIELEFFDGASQYDISSLASSFIQFTVNMIRQKTQERLP